MGDEPTLVRNELQSASIHEGLKIGTQFPFRRPHHSHGSQLRNERLQCLPVWTLCYQVPHSHAPGCLLQGEVPEVGQDKGELLFVIGATSCLPRIFHQDDPQGFRVFPGKRADAVRKLVVRNKEPTTSHEVRLSFCQFCPKDAHGAIPLPPPINRSWCLSWVGSSKGKKLEMNIPNFLLLS